MRVIFLLGSLEWVATRVRFLVGVLRCFVNPQIVFNWTLFVNIGIIVYWQFLQLLFKKNRITCLKEMDLWVILNVFAYRISFYFFLLDDTLSINYVCCTKPFCSDKRKKNLDFLFLLSLKVGFPKNIFVLFLEISRYV